MQPIANYFLSSFFYPTGILQEKMWVLHDAWRERNLIGYTALNEATAYNEAAEQLRELQTQQAAQEQAYANERRSLQARVRELDNHNQQLNSQLPHLESTIEHLETLL